MTEHIDILIEDAIKKCQTHAHVSKDLAGDLRHNGFDGEVMGDLIKNAELVVKYASMYQAYINTLVSE